MPAEPVIPHAPPSPSPAPAPAPGSADALRAALDGFAARLTRDPDQPFGLTGVSLWVQPWRGEAVRVHHGADAHGAPLGDESVFCLASVGKLAVALLVLELVALGRISLDSTVRELLPHTRGDVGHATVGELLSHRAGLRSCLLHTQVPYSAQVTRHAILDACLAEPRPHVGEGVRYSDIGYGVLGAIVEACWNGTLHDALAQRLNQPLGTSLSTGAHDAVRSVPVAHLNVMADAAAIAPMNSAFWRSLALPWVGVFGTVRDMAALLREFGPYGTLLPPALRERAVTDPHGGTLDGGIFEVGPHMGVTGAAALQYTPCEWGLGPELRGTKWPHWAPREASPQSFGHVGTSGTLVWCDPVAEVSWIMAGTRGSISGWLLRHGPALGRLALSHAHEVARTTL